MPTTQRKVYTHLVSAILLRHQPCQDAPANGPLDLAGGLILLLPLLHLSLHLLFGPVGLCQLLL